MPCSREGIRKCGIAFLITNILLIGIGTGFIIAGTLSVIEVPSLESDNTKPLLDPVLSDPFQAGGMAFGLSTLIITIGLVILGVAGLGIFLISGKWFQIKRMSAIYAVVVGVVIICQIIFMIFWCSLLVNDKVEEELKDKLTVALKENFIEDTTSNIDSISNAWNYMFMKLDCCGVDPVLSMTNDFDQTPWCTTSGSCQTSHSNIPRTCCTGVDESTYSSAPASCHRNVTSGTYNTKIAAVIIAIVICLCFGDNETKGYRGKCCGILFGDIAMQIQGDLSLQRQQDVTAEKRGVRHGITNGDGLTKTSE
nr:uncharacterized protein LOC105342105 isoform X2 [Crassostrea gigas]